MNVNIQCFYIPLHNSESVDSNFGMKKLNKKYGPSGVHCTYMTAYSADVDIYVFSAIRRDYLIFKLESHATLITIDYLQ